MKRIPVLLLFTFLRKNADPELSVPTAFAGALPGVVSSNLSRHLWHLLPVEPFQSVVNLFDRLRRLVIDVWSEP